MKSPEIRCNKPPVKTVGFDRGFINKKLLSKYQASIGVISYKCSNWANSIALEYYKSEMNVMTMCVLVNQISEYLFGFCYLLCIILSFIIRIYWIHIKGIVRL